MTFTQEIASLQKEVALWRQELHKNPETSFEEEFASSFIATKLKEWGIPFKRNIAKTGIVATLVGSKNTSGKAIGFRADMDALNITEKTELPYTSQNPGKMHACGHDGHTAMLLGAAKYLSQHPHFNGKIHFIFQPAEEGGGGAHKMIEEGLFKDFPCDYIFGLHNWPYLPLGKIGTRKGPLMASAEEFEIIIKGKGGHAAKPDQAIDPLVIGAHIVTALQTIVSRNVNPIDQGVVTVANFNAGTGAHNIIADTAILNGTLRAFKQETRELLKRRVKEIAENTAKAFMAVAIVNIPNGYDPTINHDSAVDIAVAAAERIEEAKTVDANTEPSMAAEDFGAYLTKCPGAFIFMGQADPKDSKSPHSQGLHTPYYDFNDNLIPIGISWFVKLTEKCLPIC